MTMASVVERPFKVSCARRNTYFLYLISGLVEDRLVKMAGIKGLVRDTVLDGNMMDVSVEEICKDKKVVCKFFSLVF